MKTMKTYKAIFILALFALGLGVNAQNKTNAYYTMGIPMSDTKDYISKTSFRGAGLEFEHLVKANVGVGILVGWNTFYESLAKDTYPLSNINETVNGAITGKQYRYLNVVPMLATGKYYFTDEDHPIRPFAGLGVGTYYLEQKTDMGLYSDREKSWHFGLAPKAGVLIPLNYEVSVSVAIDYNIAFKTSKIDQQNWLGINVGFSWDY